MVDSKYGIAYSEVLEILKHIPIEDYNKIPRNEIELFETYADKDFTFNYDSSKTLEEQNVSNITKGIIILLFRDYWATSYQKERIEAKEKYDIEKLEEEKREKYNPDNVFKNNKEETFVENTNLPVEIKKKTFFKKLISFIKGLFNKTN